MCLFEFELGERLSQSAAGVWMTGSSLFIYTCMWVGRCVFCIATCICVARAALRQRVANEGVYVHIA